MAAKSCHQKDCCNPKQWDVDHRSKGEITTSSMRLWRAQPPQGADRGATNAQTAVSQAAPGGLRPVKLM